jgi:hypothetical protein
VIVTDFIRRCVIASRTAASNGVLSTPGGNGGGESTKTPLSVLHRLGNFLGRVTEDAAIPVSTPSTLTQHSARRLHQNRTGHAASDSSFDEDQAHSDDEDKAQDNHCSNRVSERFDDGPEVENEDENEIESESVPDSACSEESFNTLLAPLTKTPGTVRAGRGTSHRDVNSTGGSALTMNLFPKTPTNLGGRKGSPSSIPSTVNTAAEVRRASFAALVLVCVSAVKSVSHLANPDGGRQGRFLG